MKKRTLNISKLNLKKEVISNLNEIKGGDGEKTDQGCTITINQPYCRYSLPQCETRINCNGTAG
jgi:hypothetical protein